jgi:D-serine deaminase-like pyridoxal phosphate-dependent protein
MAVGDPAERQRLCDEAMQRLAAAHADVGGDVVSAGGTLTYALNRTATEIQAGSYALMDTTFAGPGVPFEPALFVLATVISVSDDFAVADAGLKSLAMDHGNPTVEGARVWFCSDEHLTFAPSSPSRVGDRIRVWPAHVDPTVAKHAVLHLVSDDEVVDVWEVDLRGW